FFAFSQPGWDRPLSNWFLAARRGSRIVSVWRTLLRSYLGGRIRSNHRGPNGRRDQFVAHYLFDWMLAADRSLQTLWERTEPLPAEPAHRVQAYLRAPSPETYARAMHALRHAPVHKLNWRIDGALEHLESLVSDPMHDPTSGPAPEEGAGRSRNKGDRL
ncbi:MAG: capsular polysaccharide synthesis protein, partial [Myxococcota bacterium]